MCFSYTNNSLALRDLPLFEMALDNLSTDSPKLSCQAGTTNLLPPLLMLSVNNPDDGHKLYYPVSPFRR
jgi:hypothetical protein